MGISVGIFGAVIRLNFNFFWKHCSNLPIFQIGWIKSNEFTHEQL